jgi:predicted AlkP superfamily phosphohydrolase/phosphomutase
VSGRGPEWTGIYDSFRAIDYQIVPVDSAEEVEGKLLWDIVEASGKTVCRDSHIPREPVPDLVYLEAQIPIDLKSLLELGKDQIVRVIIWPSFALQRKQVNINNFLEEIRLLERNANGDIRWEETLAYCMGNGQVWINLIGREKRGVITPGQEYDQVCTALAKVLQERLVDPETEAAVVNNVWKKQERYSDQGSYFVAGPDLTLTFLPGYSPSVKSVQLSFDKEAIGSGDDPCMTFTGYKLLIWGTGVKQGYSGTGHTLDVVPTILHLLDLPLSRTLTGRVMRDVFTDEYWDSHPVRYQDQDELTQTEEALIMDRLEALGYVD